MAFGSLVIVVDKRRADSESWLDTYRRAFPGLRSAVSVRQDGWAQRGRADRVTLASGQTFTVDEKVRAEEWNAILLEKWSDASRRAPGRVQKPLTADFIADANAPSGICFLLPVAPLQRAWRPARPLVDHGIRAAAGAKPRLCLGQRAGARSRAHVGDRRCDGGQWLIRCAPAASIALATWYIGIFSSVTARSRVAIAA